MSRPRTGAASLRRSHDRRKVGARRASRKAAKAAAAPASSHSPQLRANPEVAISATVSSGSSWRVWVNTLTT